MKLLLLSLSSTLLIYSHNVSIAQTRIETKLSVLDDNNIGSFLYFGLDTAATDGLDSTLGESEFFPSHPPSGMHAVIQFPKPGNQWCYRDYRKLILGQISMKESQIEVQPASLRANAPINFIWNFPLAKGIDSIIIVDRKTNGIRARFSLDTKRKFIVNDEQSDSFLLRAYYRTEPIGVVEEHHPNNRSVISPNPAAEAISISEISPNELLQIVAADGRVYTPELNGNCINVQNVPAGVYAVTATGISGKRFLGMFVKQ